jgi:hypothetical protein
LLQVRYISLDHLEVLGTELAAGLFDQKNLAIDAAAHGVSSSFA